MKKELQVAQRRVERVTGRLEKRLGLSGWVRIEHHFVTVSEDEEDEPAAASVRIRWELREASMKWRLQEVAVVDDDELQLIALHEYVHILIDPFAQLIPKKKLHGKLEELAVESVARALQAALGEPC